MLIVEPREGYPTRVDREYLACHSVDQGKKLGPDVAGVTRRRTDAWLTQWLKSPEKMLKTDPDAQAMLQEYNNLPMPNQGLGDTEIAQYLAYFHWIDAQPVAAPQPAASK